MPKGTPHKPTAKTRALVVNLQAAAVPQDVIAKILRTDAKTLRRNYRAEIDFGVANLGGELVGELRKLSKGADKKAAAVALIWLTKNVLKWTDTQRISHEGHDGGPINSVSEVRVWLPPNGRDDPPPLVIEGKPLKALNPPPFTKGAIDDDTLRQLAPIEASAQ